MTDVAFFLGSSSGSAPSDTVKDRRALAWLPEFPADVQKEWLARCQMIRYADRLVESEIAVVSGWRFDLFRRAVEHYLAVLDEYTRPGLLIRTMAQHDEMLIRLGGGAFRVLPFYEIDQMGGVAAFGALDQFWNNERDRSEDLARGMCYLPADLLEAHGLTREQVLRGEAVALPGWQRLMGYWLDEYESLVRSRAQPFLEATGLHPSWERFRAERLAEYARIEQGFREVGFDYREFARRYA